ncbi:helix-turn-helix domain-containing protein [Brenneria tiliae]|uniref:Helix-turn-helix domain-containing protein n=1 Tax=Brenneria tiliae TaxID=2914984 RepID=A0ABT0MVV3_9GAMM|nr:helix-turn-helix domain-containing protein [Brenneria tiliae]MCL2893980.1 helix-turn-helix domain-containing protein [Brenneria tiliae]
MKTIFTTHDYPEDKRFSIFRETVKDRFLLSYDCQPADRLASQRFYANLTGHLVADLKFVVIQSNSHVAVSNAGRCGLSQEDHFYIELQRSGTSTLTQDGRSVFLRQGDFAFFDMARPVTWAFDNDYSLFKLLIPREKLTKKIGNTQHLTSRAIRGNTVIGNLVYSFFLKYVPVLETLSPANAQSLADVLLNLITTALSELSQGLPNQSINHATLFYMAQQYIENNLHNHELKVEDCARACGISVRYLQKLFHDQNTTINKLICQKRLELYKSALTNPLMAGKNISQIAYDCGFNDISNLCRKFKLAYAMTPYEYRKYHAERQSLQSA